MRFSAYASLAVLLVLLGSMSGALAEPDPTDSESYYSYIVAPCRGGDCAELKGLLARLETECAKVDAPCPPGQKILDTLFDKGYRPSLADFITYFKQSSGAFVGKPKGVLMWQRMNTPHLYGARDIYALVFSEEKICLDASIAVDFKSEPNPFTGIFAALGGKADDAKAAAPTRTVTGFTWLPLSGNPAAPGMWLGIARMSIDTNSADRLNIEYKQRTQPAGKDVPEECAAAPAGTSAKPSYTGEFLSANAFFSNSPDSRIGISVALGLTLNPKNTSVATGDGANQYFNGYAFAKYYVRRPQLRAGPNAEGRDTSLGLVIGTNITKSTFSEIVYGVSIGHLVGNMGLIVGVNSLQGAKDSHSGRKSRAFLGLEYSF